MDKIKDLLKQLGGTPELIEQVCKELQNFKDRAVTEANTTLQQRLEKAKTICLEEVSKEKSDLARKVEIFLEARIASIDREARKQAAIGESESAKTLRDIKNLLEGVQNDGAQEGNQAATAENKKLRVMVAKLQESTKSLEESAKRANSIAMKALQRNKLLESQTTSEKPVVTEGKEQAGTNLETVRTTTSDPKTTRQVMTESQVKAPAAQAPAQNSDIAAIAEKLDGTPAYVGK